MSELPTPQPAGEVMAWFAKHEAHLYVSSITLGEIHKGLEMMPPGKRKSVKVAMRIADFAPSTSKSPNSGSQITPSSPPRPHPPFLPSPPSFLPTPASFVTSPPKKR